MSNIRYAAKHGPNLINTLDALANAREFDAGNLKAKRLPVPGYLGDTGELPHEWREAMRRDNPHYVVYSYRTPIAWLANRGGRKVFVVPPVKYSTTTSNHQGVTRRGVEHYTDQLA